MAELVFPQLPGRGVRAREVPCGDLDEAATRLAEELMAFNDNLPLAVFGHSLGALLAFELTRRLAAAGRPPVLLCVSARRGPRLTESHAPIAHLPLPAFVDAVQRRYGGIPEAVLQDAELLDLLAPGLRGDIAMLETYRYRVSLPLTCPVLAFGGSRDPHASRAELEAWALETTGPFSLHMIDDGHFFLQSGRAAIIEQVHRALAGSAALQPGYQGR